MLTKPNRQLLVVVSQSHRRPVRRPVVQSRHRLADGTKPQPVAAVSLVRTRVVIHRAVIHRVVVHKAEVRLLHAVPVQEVCLPIVVPVDPVKPCPALGLCQVVRVRVEVPHREEVQALYQVVVVVLVAPVGVAPLIKVGDHRVAKEDGDGVPVKNYNQWMRRTTRQKTLQYQRARSSSNGLAQHKTSGRS